ERAVPEGQDGEVDGDVDLCGGSGHMSRVGMVLVIVTPTAGRLTRPRRLTQRPPTEPLPHAARRSRSAHPLSSCRSRARSTSLRQRPPTELLPLASSQHVAQAAPPPLSSYRSHARSTSLSPRASGPTSPGGARRRPCAPSRRRSA